MSKLYLLDGHALVYRSHFAFINRPLVNSKGMNTSAVVGFVRTLWDIMKKQQPTHLAVCFDTSKPTFRHERYEPYKAQRDEQPEDISRAIPIITQILEAFRIPILSMDGYEADDLIGTLAKQAEKEDFEVYMVTPDKDFGQLVSDKVFLYKPSRMGNGVDIWGVKDILEKWQINRIEQVIDMLALQGDSVDNIPGVPGIGPKTASKLLLKYDSVENLIAHVDELKGKQQERVRDNAELALLSKELATINIESPVTFNADMFIIEEPDRETLASIFKDLEIRTLANAILGDGKTTKPKSSNPQQGDLFGSYPDHSAPAAHSVADKNIANSEQEYILVDTKEAREALIKMLEAASAVCFDTETTGIDANEAELVGMSFALAPKQAWYVPVPTDQEEAKKIVNGFKHMFENEKITKIGQNLKYDMLMLKWMGIEVKGKLEDTMLIHYLLEPELRHNLNYLSETYLKYQPVSIETLIGKKGKNQKSMRDIEVVKVSQYACEDADITYRLLKQLKPEVQKEPQLWKMYREIEAPLVNVLCEMEYNGIKIDSDQLKEYSQELGELIGELKKEIEETAEAQFNIGSPKQVGEILFDKMKLPYRWSKTKSGQYSTSEDKLSEMAEDHVIVANILRYRGLTKLKSTYVDALPKLINPRTGRIHSSFNQALASTGRLSSNNPNLQNIPIRTAEGRRIRESFIARNENFVLLAADYSQIELRLIAEISEDEAMLEAFIGQKDIHRSTAARVYDTAYDDVTADQRRNAKTVNFAIIYGTGAYNLGRQLGISRSEASDLIEQYFKQYPGLKNYMDSSVETARQQGFVTTLLGRKRYIRDINSRNNNIRSGAERVAINSPIQGTAADMIKVAMVNIHKELQKRNSKTKLILQVHDELVFDLHRSEQEELVPVITKLMSDAIPGLKVPIVVEAGIGEHWLEAH